MTSRRPTFEASRYANLTQIDIEVLGAPRERVLLRELADCKGKLSKALADLKGIEPAPTAAEPRAMAELIAATYVDDGPGQARLGAIYRRYSEIRGQLALANLKLVAHIAKRFRDRGIPNSDLMQEGFCGLLEAIDRFNLTHETKLATYATWWIRQAMQRAVASGAYPVRLTPRHLRQLAQNQEATGEVDPGSGRDEPTTIEGRSVIIDRIHAATRRTISLDATVTRDSDFTVMRTMSDLEGDRTDQVDTDETIERLMGVLRPREQQVLALRFGLGGRERLSLTQVGKILEVSKERVRQIEERALKKLRASAEKRGIEPSWGL